MNDVAESRPFALLYTTVRDKWPSSLSFASETHFALGVSLLWAALYNLQFWEHTLAATWRPSLDAVVFLGSLFALVLSVQATLLLLMPSITLLRAAASALFLAAATGAYFCNEYGAIMNKDMLRNVLQSDLAEISGLINANMIAHIVVFGVLPAALCWRASLPDITWVRRLKQRAKFFAAAIPLCVAGLFACSANYAVYFREHKPVRFMLMPAAPVSSLIGLLGEGRDRHAHTPLLNPAGSSQRVALKRTRPLMLFVVVGETARAENFQLGGYARSTNPQLQRIENLVYFGHTVSCATSTAVSVPCMFSHLGRQQFDIDEAGHFTNLLDSLAHAGLAVEWRDNNAGCKGVCARVDAIDYSDRPNPSLCPHSYCYDEIMLTDLAARLRSLERDTVIVFHQIGSHGPAYAERYPPQFERFKPACRSNQLHRCSAQEIVNAYDNTIAYTDDVLARQIAMLQEAADRVDGMLIYASDHGESLGEQGIYLHGLPYSFAPRLQKEIPMLLWTSQGYDERIGLRAGCVRARAGEPFSHDNLYHTILGAAGVRNRVYDRRLDILAPCRDDAGPSIMSSAD
jgi:lipid A ethanolaminephosphotransferase